MNCNQVREQLSSYLDGALSDAERHSVDHHLESCAECDRQLSELRRTVQAVRSLDEVEPPPWFAKKVMQRVEAVQARKPALVERLFFPLRVKVPLQAIGILLISISAVFIFRSMRHNDTLLSPPERAGREESRINSDASSSAKEMSPEGKRLRLEHPEATVGTRQVPAGEASAPRSASPGKSGPAGKVMARETTGQVHTESVSRPAPEPARSAGPGPLEEERAPEVASPALSGPAELPAEMPELIVTAWDIDRAAEKIHLIAKGLDAEVSDMRLTKTGVVITMEILPRDVRTLASELSNLPELKEITGINEIPSLPGSKDRMKIRLTVSQ